MEVIETSKIILSYGFIKSYMQGQAASYKVIYRKNATTGSLMSARFSETEYNPDATVKSSAIITRNTVKSEQLDGGLSKVVFVETVTPVDEPILPSSGYNTIVRQKIFTVGDVQYIIELRICVMGAVKEAIKEPFTEFAERSGLSIKLIARTTNPAARVTGFSTDDDRMYARIIKQFLDCENNRRSPDGLSIRNLVVNPVTMTKNIYSEIYGKSDYYVSKKIDGIHCIVVLNKSRGTKLYVLTDKHIYEISQQPGVDHDAVFDKYVDGFYVFEGEFYAGPSDCTADFLSFSDITPAFDHDTTKLILFDTLIFTSKSIKDEPLIERTKPISAFANTLKLAGIKALEKRWYKIGSTMTSAEIKAQYKEMDTDEDMEGLNCDGYILAMSYSAKKLYKWKSVKDTTIDFCLKLANIDTTTNMCAYWLCCGISGDKLKSYGKSHSVPKAYIEKYKRFVPADGAYGMIPFAPFICPYDSKYYSSDTGLDGRICEFSFDVALQKFIIHRIREDKIDSFGNNIDTVEVNWININNELTHDMLWNFDAYNKRYFAQRKDEIYKNMTAYMKYVKENLIAEFGNTAGTFTALDIGIGEGQDLFRYMKFCGNMRRIIGVEIDSDALSVCAKRRMEIVNPSTYSKPGDRGRGQGRGGRGRGGHYDNRSAPNTPSFKSHPDLMLFNNSATEMEGVVKQLMIMNPDFITGDETIDVVFVMASVHYYIDQIGSIMEAASKCAHKGTKLVILCMNGQTVFNRLKDIGIGERIVFSDSDYEKYIIEKDYDGALKQYGQQIKVKLPFSKVLYPEQLVNVDFMTKSLKTAGFVRIHNQPITSLLDVRGKTAYGINFNLSDADIKWLELWHYVVYEYEGGHVSHSNHQDGGGLTYVKSTQTTGW